MEVVQIVHAENINTVVVTIGAYIVVRLRLGHAAIARMGNMKDDLNQIAELNG